MGTTHHSGYVSQHHFRRILGNFGVSIQAAIFASPGGWTETREVTKVVDVRTGEKRAGPVKETLAWIQHRPCQTGPVEYEPFVRSVMQGDAESAKAKACTDTARDAAQLYSLWKLVTENKRSLLYELNQRDTGAVGHVSVGDFHAALQLGTGCSSSDAKLVVANIPLAAGSGWIDYRRWLVEFCKDPRIDWQAYLSVDLLATGTHQIESQQSEAELRAGMMHRLHEEHHQQHPGHYY
eukprot:TRINITY_DN54557_c0_g1_i1.p1 TRINITY_DN54557_c0_g1~~TRINITY_DN54557_c0_g1_i1.p1  ORF type:complete len:237 (-),score=62.60 TRINITY_DN54557_c0_g1_i1:441-1151(-)